MGQYDFSLFATNWKWILVRQEVHTLSIGNGLACTFSTGPGRTIALLPAGPHGMRMRTSFQGHSHCQYLIALQKVINTGSGNGLGVRLGLEP